MFSKSKPVTERLKDANTQQEELFLLHKVNRFNFNFKTPENQLKIHYVITNLAMASIDLEIGS